MTTVGNQRYRLERRLWAGDFTTVWLARDLRLARSVAVKRMSRRAATDPHARARFARGIMLAARIDHEHVVRLLDADQHCRRPYLVEEFIPGEALDQILRRGHLPPATAVRITGALARALSHIHGRGVVHCDVKPGNILIRNDGGVKLCDFGIAKDIRDSSPGGVFGSIHYMSPQRVAGATPGPQCDIYGLGVTFYEMISGHKPFEGSNPLQVAIAHRRGDALPIRARGDLSPAAVAVLGGMIATAPDERYKNAGYVAMSLEAVLAHPECIAV